jgi:hypothetical protein
MLFYTVQIISFFTNDKTIPSNVTVEAFTTSLLSTLTCFGPYRPKWSSKSFNSHTGRNCFIICNFVNVTDQNETNKKNNKFFVSNCQLTELITVLSCVVCLYELLFNFKSFRNFMLYLLKIQFDHLRAYWILAGYQGLTSLLPNKASKTRLPVKLTCL